MFKVLLLGTIILLIVFIRVGTIIPNIVLGPYKVLHPTYVYSKPRDDSRRVARIKRGTKIHVVAVKGDWLEVRSKHGRAPGFIKKDSAVPIAPRSAALGSGLKHPSQMGKEKFPVRCVSPTRVTSSNRVSFEQPLLLMMQGLNDAAYALFLDLLCEWPDAANKSEILFYLVMNRQAAGDLEAAVWFYEKSLESKEMMSRSGGRRAHEHVVDLFRVGEMYAMLGDERKLQEKISEAESILSRRQAREVEKSFPQVYLRLARLYVWAGEISRSIHVLKRGEEVAKKRYASQIPAIELAELSRAYVEAGEFAVAKRLAKKALETSGKPDYGAQFTAFKSLAIASVSEGKGSAALQYLREYEEAKARHAAEIRSLRTLADLTLAPMDYRERPQTASLFGQAYSLVGQSRKAVAKFLEAVETTEALRGFMGVNDRISFFGQFTDPYYLLVDSLLTLEKRGDGANWEELEGRDRSPKEIAFHYVEAARARFLSEQIARSRARGVEGKLPDDLAQRERDLLGRAKAELRRGIPFDESHAHREFQAFVRSLRKTHPNYAALKYPIPVNVSQVPMRDKEALLAYILLEKRVVVWLLQRGHEPRIYQIPVGRERVLKTISSMRVSLEPNSEGTLPPFDTQASGDLYQWLLAKPLKSVARGSRIIVVPDSALTIPFEILTVRRPDGSIEFAGQQYIFSYSPSATVFTQLRTFRSPKRSLGSQGRLLAVGDPVYDEEDPRGRKQSGFKEATLVAARSAALRDYSRKRRMGIFSRLPGTHDEVKQIASALGVNPKSPDILLGPRANEHDLKGLDLTRYRYLHFATHGVLAQDLPYLKQPALVLSQVGDLKGEDGFLTMEEVLNLNLRSDLTVLSACQTGLGQEISGEGIVGLMRAFLYAGSRSVVVSLWRVEDRSTADLMVNFYRYIAQGLPFPEALIRAKHDLRIGQGGRFAHPFYWAPFILFGSD